MRSISILICVFLLLSLPATAAACFGPKLYLGTSADIRSDVLFALVSLYVKEKTGTEMVRVPLEGKDPVRELRQERVDLAFLQEGGEKFEPTLLRVPGWPALGAGKRPLEDLQFTTVPAALRKLGGLLTATHLEEISRRTEEGASAAAAARHFLMDKGWI